MLAPFLIMLREGIEAALITGIVATYLSHTGRSEWMPAVWVGVLLAVAVSLFAGAGLLLLSADFPQKAQELFEAVVGLVAVAVLISMVFWMRRAARSIKSELQHSVDTALASSHGGTWALIGLVFFAVAREGLEIRLLPARHLSAERRRCGAPRGTCRYSRCRNGRASDLRRRRLA